MPMLIADVFLFEILAKCVRKVDACLVRKTNQHPENVGEFVAEIMVRI